MQSRDERVTIRLKPCEREELADGARAMGDELSRYIRKMSLTGHRITCAQRAVQATGA
jgi:hypothetical protein